MSNIKRKIWNSCPLCGGKLAQKKVTHPQEHEGQIIILENVPAEVCEQCGEVLLRPEAADRVQKLVWSQPPPKRTAHVPVYDLEETI